MGDGLVGVGVGEGDGTGAGDGAVPVPLHTVMQGVQRIIKARIAYSHARFLLEQPLWRLSMQSKCGELLVFISPQTE